MIVTLSNTVSVNPLHVADVVIDDEKNRVILTMADGRHHSLPCQYRKTIWATRDEMVEKLNLPFMKELRIEGGPELDEFLKTYR